MFQHSKSEKNLRSYFHICDSILSDISTDYITSDTLEKLPLTMTTKEWQYLESELDTYSTMETVILTSETNDESHCLDESADRLVPLLTKSVSVANLNELYMICRELTSTFAHEEVMQEDMPNIPMQVRY